MSSEALYVNTKDELIEALQSASGGETIYMNPGDYGALSLRGSSATDTYKFDTPVTIKSADPDDPATVDRLDLTFVKNITFDGIKVDANPQSDVVAGYLVTIGGSEGVTFKNGEVDGGLVDSTAGIKSGFFVVNSSDVALDGNDIHNLLRGSVVTSVDGLSISNNSYTENVYDHADFGANLNDVVVDGNTFGPIKVSLGGANHPDHIQFWTAGATENTTNVTISNNTIFQTEAGTQSIFIGADPNGFTINGLNIFGNTIYNAQSHGISISGVNGANISGNTVVSSGLLGDGSVYQPKINVFNSNDVTISGNATMGIGLSGNTNTTEFGNVILQNLVPNGENYVDSALVNATAGANTTLEDLMPLPDGILANDDGTFVGSLEFAPADNFTVIALQSSSESQGERTVVFEAMVANTEGENIADDTMTYRWEFADGTIKSGRTVEHEIVLGGDQSVNLTVSDDAGNQDQATKYFTLPHRDALKLDFENGVLDTTGNETQVKWIGEESLVTGDNGNKLAYFNGEPNAGNGSYIRLGNDPELFDAEKLTLALSFQAEPESIEARQTLFYAHARYGIQLNGGDQLIIYLDGWRYIDGVNYADGQPHTVGLTFENGEAVVYFDGEIVANLQTSFDAIPPVGAWNPTIGGSPYASNVFNGYIDDVLVIRETLNAEDMLALHNGDLDLPESQPETQPDETPAPEEPGDSDNTPPEEPDDTSGEDDTAPPSIYNEILGTGASETLQGTDGDDRIFGGVGKDIIEGGDGDDIIEGGIHADILSGGNGNDTLIGGHSTDILTGGAGSDTFVFKDVSFSTAGGTDIITDFEEGVDRIDLTAMSYTGIVERGQSTAIGELEYYEENGGIVIHDPNSPFMIRLEGNSTLDINDVMLSNAPPVFGDNDDVVNITKSWGEQDDWGSSVFDLGGGDDVITIKNYSADVIFGNSGNDRIDVGHGQDIVYGGDGDDAINGQAHSDMLYGESGNDWLVGGHGSDLLDGGTGDDTLEGGIHRDTLLGGDGDDVLIGGEGKDLLTGGDGKDVFVYQSAADSTTTGRDVVMDFIKGEDKIDVSALGFTGLAASESSAADTELVISQENGQTILANEAQGFEILFEGNIDITLEDLLI